MLPFNELLKVNIAKLDLCDALLSNFKLENIKAIDDAISQIGSFVAQNRIEFKQESSFFLQRYEALKEKNKARPTKDEIAAKEVLKTILYLIKRVPNVQKVENYPRLKQKIDAVKSKMNQISDKVWLPDALQLELNNKLLELESAYQLKEREQAIIEEIENARTRIQNGISALNQRKTNLVDAYEELLNAYTDSKVLLSQISFADDKEKGLFTPYMNKLERTRQLVNKPLQDANRTFVNLIIKELGAAVQRKDIQQIKSIKPRMLDVPRFATELTADAQKKAFSKAYKACYKMEKSRTKTNNLHIEYHCKNHNNKQQSKTVLSIPTDKLQEIELFLQRTKDAYIIQYRDQERVKRFKNEMQKSFDSLKNLLVEYQNNHHNTDQQTDEILQKHRQLLLAQTNYETLIQSNILPALNELDKQKEILINRRDSNKRKNEFDSAIDTLSHLTTDLDNKIVEYLQTEMPTAQFKSDFQQIVEKVDRDVLSSPRGDWSVTRVLDRLAEAIDAIIDFMRGQQQRTSKLAFSFLHHKTTSETIYEQLVDVVNTTMQP